MTNEVRGLKVGSKVIACTFNSLDLPPDGAFKGWAIDHTVTAIIDDTTVTLAMVKDPSKTIDFNFRDDTVNFFYQDHNRPTWFTGIFTDLKLMFDLYKDLYVKLKGPIPGTKTEEVKKDE